METKQTEKKHKTGKTKHQAPTVSANPNTLETFYLEEEHKICFMLEIPKLFSPVSGDSLKYIFMASWPMFKLKKEKRNKISYKVLKQGRKIVRVSSRNPSLNDNTVLIPAKEKSLN